MISVIIEPSYDTRELIKTLNNLQLDYQIVLGPTDDYFNNINKTLQQAIKAPSGKPIRAIINLYEECNARGQMLADLLYNQPIPCTSPNASLYDITRYDLKSTCLKTNSKTPLYFFSEGMDSVDSIKLNLKGLMKKGVTNVFIKPGRGFNSIGIDKESCQPLMFQDESSFDTIIHKIEYVAQQFGSALVEEYIDGKEISILILPPLELGQQPLVLKPVEFCFKKALLDQNFITNEWKLNYEIEYWYEENAYDQEGCLEAMNMVKDVYQSFNFNTYVRFDIRIRKTSNNIVECFLLDVNTCCSVINYSTAVTILKANGKDNNWFVDYIIKSATNLKK
ncbi:hypothetical protein CYY_003277 [Polysphondylium violaceum]|uniref:D-alanine--D-alanine ligase C-terminal domain-containing protein n=1 Tax=Polysphondylium violaceum TaxID=133409 RepID=A0A8J4PWM3_9MYCE|nr:hypothetical protein CYY_003277 [Polysphondylium violaceum]